MLQKLEDILLLHFKSKSKYFYSFKHLFAQNVLGKPKFVAQGFLYLNVEQVHPNCMSLTSVVA